MWNPDSQGCLGNLANKKTIVAPLDNITNLTKPTESYCKAHPVNFYNFLEYVWILSFGYVWIRLDTVHFGYTFSIRALFFGYAIFLDTFGYAMEKKK